jgi:hypothetical protein
MHHRIHQVVFRVAPALAALLAISCLNDGGKGDDPPTVKKELYGRFLVNLVEGTSFSDPFASVVGRVTDGPTPSVLAWDTTATSGACKLLVPRAPFCDPGCGSSHACLDEGGTSVCKPYPKALNVGTVTLTGLKTTSGATSITMSPILLTYQPTAGTVFQFPPFAEGDAVTVSASGDTVGAFTLSAKAIKPLAPLFDSIILADNQAVTLQWAPKGGTGSSTVSAQVDISHHGGLKGIIACEGPDDGQLTIAATLVNQLKALGIAGFPTVELARHASGARGDMSVDLWIESRVTRAVSIPGLVSCFDDEDCPSGQTCQQDFKCQ